jgi:endo-1,3(4)-beta-glucanase
VRRRLVVAALVCLAVVLAGCVAQGAEPNAEASRTDALAGLPRQDVSDDPPSRASDDIAPPTNRWYSGMVFGDQPQTVHPFPLAITPSDSGFSMALPGVAASADSIFSAEAPTLTVGIEADAYEVVRADPVSVTAEYSSGGVPQGRMTLAAGWPVVGYVADADTVFIPSAPLAQSADGVWTATVGEQVFGVVAPAATWADGALRVPAESSAQWFAVPADSSVDAWADALGDPVTSVAASHMTADEGVSTSLVYEGGDSTVLVPFPGHGEGASCELGTFATPYGVAAACAGTTSEWAVPALAPTARYDFEQLDAATAQQLGDQVAVDLDATGELPTDTYYAGKALARLATLLEIARALDDTELADRVADRLHEEIAPWVDPARCEVAVSRCFVYDEALRLVVGLEPSFGSELANDHHFHYGHFLTAAASLADYRPALVEELAPVIDLLAADIATGAADEMLPTLRVFDPYRGHSWASGLSPFGDGNNQESSSEAVAAWNGLSLWATASGNDELASTGEWLLSAEAAAAGALWLEPDELPDGYSHGIVSLTWGAKRDYATWFSAEPSAILGIQLIPLGPVALEYVADDPARVDANVAEAGGIEAAAGPLGDYVAMYAALGTGAAASEARAALDALGEDGLDDGNSRAAVLAWLAAIELRE